MKYKYHIKIESEGTAREIVEGLHRLAATIKDSTRTFREELGSVEIEDEGVIMRVFELPTPPTPVAGYLHKVRVKGGYKILHTPHRGKEAPIKGFDGVYTSDECNSLIEHLSRNGWGRWLR